MRRKNRKNFRGDSLIEVILSFAIIAIMGLTIVTGVVSASSIKVNTTRLKQASLEADKNLQDANTCNTAAATASIYNINTSGQKEGDAIVENLSTGKYIGASDNSRVQYDYYNIIYGGDPENPLRSSSTKIRKFGLTGQWFVRFYLDQNTVSQNHILKIKLSGGRPNSKLTLNEASIKDIRYGGYVKRWEDVNNNWEGWESSNFTQSKTVTEKDLTFDPDGNLVMDVNVTINQNYWNNEDCSYDLDYIDMPIWWTGDCFYGVDIEFLNINADGTETSVGDIVNKYKVYGTALDVLSPAAGSPLSSNFSSSLHDDCSLDDDTKYIYIWDRNDTANPNGKWLYDFQEDMNDRLLWRNEYRNMSTWNAGNNGDLNFLREYLRTEDSTYYEEYKSWLGNIPDNQALTAEYTEENYVFWVYYMLDILHADTTESDSQDNVRILNDTGTEIHPTSFEDYARQYFASTSYTTNQTPRRTILKFLMTFYHPEYTSFYNDIVDYAQANSISESYYLEFLWAYYNIAKNKSYVIKSHEFRNLYDYCSQTAANESAYGWEHGLYESHKKIWQHLTADQISNVKNLSNSTTPTIAKANEIIAAIQTKTTAQELAQYGNTSIDSNDEIRDFAREAIMSIKNPDEYQKYLDWLSANGQDSANRNDYYISAFWKYYCLDVLNDKTDLNLDGINNSESVNSFEDLKNNMDTNYYNKDVVNSLYNYLNNPGS